MTDEDLKKIGDLVDQKINIGLESIKKDLNEVKDIQENQLLPSVVSIENTIKVYGDMYKINNDNAKKLEKRVKTLEVKAGIQSPPELILAEVYSSKA